MTVSHDMKNTHNLHTVRLSFYTYSEVARGIYGWVQRPYHTDEDASRCEELIMIMRATGSVVSAMMPRTSVPAFRIVARLARTNGIASLSEYHHLYRPGGRLWEPVSEWFACESGACQHPRSESMRLAS